MSSLLPSLPTAPVIRPSTELQSDPCCDKAEQVKHEIKPFVDLNHRMLIYATARLWTRVAAKSLGGSAAPPRDHRGCFPASPLSSLVKQSCFSRLSSSKPQHINNICSTPVQAPRDQTHRSYHFFIREQVPRYPTLLGLGD